MFFSRVTIAPQFLSRAELQKLYSGDNYAEHQLLWRLFDDDSRHYLFRREVGDRGPDQGSQRVLPVYYLVSKDQPLDCIGLNVQSKPYQPNLAAGNELGFTLRANPVVAKKRQDKKNGQREDLMLAARREAEAQNLQGPAFLAHVDNSVKDWLLTRAADHGFDIDPQRLLYDCYQRHRFYKRRGGNAINVSSVDYNGVLTVKDPEQFRQTLFNGIGRAKAFGCGMLMVRRVSF